jgi:hypothetical protein
MYELSLEQVTEMIGDNTPVPLSKTWIRATVERYGNWALCESVPYKGVRGWRFADFVIKTMEDRVIIHVEDQGKRSFTFPLKMHSDDERKIWDPWSMEDEFLYRPLPSPEGLLLFTLGSEKAVHQRLYVPFHNDPFTDALVPGVPPYDMVAVPPKSKVTGTCLVAGVTFSMDRLAYRIGMDRASEAFVAYRRQLAEGLIDYDSMDEPLVIIGGNSLWQQKLGIELTKDDEWMQYHLCQKLPRLHPLVHYGDPMYQPAIAQGSDVIYSGREWKLALESPLTMPIPKNKVGTDQWYTLTP